jgi:hypothetical protein
MTNPGSPTPGIRDQIGSTIAAGKRLVLAHIDLAKAELSEIVGEVRRMVALAGVALGLLFMVALMLTLGLLLFLGELLFGSIGWGVLLGTFLLLDVALTLLLAALGVSGGRIARAFLVAVVLGVVVGLVLGLDLTHRGWTALADQLVPTLDPGWRTAAVAAGALALVGGVLGLVGGFRSGARGAFGGLFAGAILGAVVGLITSIAIPVTVGAALGTLVALIAWPALAGLDVARTGIDGEALRQRFVPDQTIELTKETIEWVRARTPLAPKS